jgi:predicted Holliday junction resolvase-like endonuclease
MEQLVALILIALIVLMIVLATSVRELWQRVVALEQRLGGRLKNIKVTNESMSRMRGNRPARSVHAQ